MAQRKLFSTERIADLEATALQRETARRKCESLLHRLSPEDRRAMTAGDPLKLKAPKDELEACREFHRLADLWHQHYHDLWPQELVKALWLPNGDPSETDVLILFLQEDPMFLRSGYAKEVACKRLARLALDDDQRARILALCIRALHGETRREFRAYCRLARGVQGPALWQELSRCLTNQATTVRLHALWMTEAISPSGGSSDSYKLDGTDRLQRAAEFLAQRLNRQ